MNLQRLFFAVGAACVIFSSCDLIGGGGGGVGGGAGGGGGSSTFTFSKGFTFVRKDDRNVYIADDSDLQTSATLTSSAGVLNPTMSRDGKLIAFVQKTGTTTTLSTVPVAGGTPTSLLVSDTLNGNFHHPMFSPDGTKIVFSYDQGSVNNLGLINIDGSGFAKLIGGGALSYALASFTPDGKSVISAAGNSASQLRQIEKIDLATGLTTNVTNTLGTEAATIANRLVVSPDGLRVAFDAHIDTGVTRIFSMVLDTKVVTQANTYMGEPNTNDSSPTWYTNSSLAFSSDSGGNDNVYKVNLDKTERKLLMPKAIEPFYGPLR